MYVDEEVEQLSNIIQVGDVVYAAGSKGSYVFIAAYSGGGRLWATTINLGGSVTILNFNLEGGVLELIAHSRLQNVTRLNLVRVGLDGAVIDSSSYTVNPRLFPLTALRIGDSIYIAGASYILGYNFNYMVARVSGKGVEWVQEEIGGPGDEVLKCAGITLGSRLLLAGDNGTSVSIMIVSQLGDLLRHYVISYTNVTVTINGCLRLSDSKFILYGALDGRPLLIPVIVESNLDIRVPSQNIGDITGVITAGAGYGDIMAFYATSGNQQVILVYMFSDSQLKLLGAVNITGVEGNLIALSGAYTNTSLAFAGYIVDGKPRASVLSLTLTVTSATRGRIGVPEIPLLNFIGDVRLTLALLATIVALSAYITYTRVKRRSKA